MNKKELVKNLQEKIRFSIEGEENEKKAGRDYTKMLYVGRKTAFQEALLMVLQA